MVMVFASSMHKPFMQINNFQVPVMHILHTIAEMAYCQLSFNVNYVKHIIIMLDDLGPPLLHGLSYQPQLIPTPRFLL